MYRGVIFIITQPVRSNYAESRIKTADINEFFLCLHIHTYPQSVIISHPTVLLLNVRYWMMSDTSFVEPILYV